jgi:hypothetical protein
MNLNSSHKGGFTKQLSSANVSHISLDDLDDVVGDKGGCEDLASVSSTLSAGKAGVGQQNGLGSDAGDSTYREKDTSGGFSLKGRSR